MFFFKCMYVFLSLLFFPLSFLVCVYICVRLCLCVAVCGYTWVGVIFKSIFVFMLTWVYFVFVYDS